MTKETEADTRANRIDPVLKLAGWGVIAGSEIRREVICPGRIQSGGRRGSSLSCDYVLIYNGHKLATLEAKRAGRSHRDGIAQAKNYAMYLDTPIAIASNGIKWYQINMQNGEENEMSGPFPSPEQLWKIKFATNNSWRNRFAKVPFTTDRGKWQPRYYQHRAIESVLEAIANNKKRVLLTLATGTGKTPIAFQVAWGLFQSKWNLSGEPQRRPRILFLTDRNILADQAFNAFSAFPKGSIVRIDPDSIRSRGGAPRNASIFFSIFQTFTTGDENSFYKEYRPDFFDFIIVDECHRGGARDESYWRSILEHFEPAVQLGLTATPKREINADTYAYFGNPVYTYSLRSGIEDGYLTPFKVRHMVSTIDEYVYSLKDNLIAGEVEAGTRFTESEINTKIVIADRERSRIEEFLNEVDQSQKAIVFCATQDHAALVRDLINQLKDSKDPNYCQRVTADDAKLGEQHLRDFQDNEKYVPTILTTSQKLSTGVDARNIRHIVLMRPIRSIIEFKQIIGRGTRTFEGKDFFTIWDFVKAHENFNDPEWDGEPVSCISEGSETGISNDSDTDDAGHEQPTNKDWDPPEKIVIELSDGTKRSIQYLKTTSYWNAEGKLISAKRFLNQLFGSLTDLIATEDELRAIWTNPETRENFLLQLDEHGYDIEDLQKVKELVNAPQSDLFDVLSYILFDIPPMTRRERASGVNLSSQAEEMKTFLRQVLEAYVTNGEGELNSESLGNFITARFGSVTEGMKKLGDSKIVRDAYLELQTNLYQR